MNFKWMITLLLAGTFAVFGQTKIVTKNTTGINLNHKNGKTVVTFKGEEVWSGPTQNNLSARSIIKNGEEYAVAFEGDKVLWENVPGAAKQLPKANVPARRKVPVNEFLEKHEKTFERLDKNQRKRLEEFMRELRKEQRGKPPVSNLESRKVKTKTSISSSASGQNITLTSDDMTIKRVNGATTLTWNGKDYDLGPTKGNLTSKSKSTDGKEYLVILENDQVIWENIPGASKHFD